MKWMINIYWTVYLTTQTNEVMIASKYKLIKFSMRIDFVRCYCNTLLVLHSNKKDKESTPKKKYFSVRSCAVHFVRELNIIFQQKCILYEMTVLCPAKTYYRTVTLTIGGVPNLYSRAVHES